MTKDEFEKLSPAADRLNEAHFFLHDLEAYYHFADPFRWHMNAFLRSIKEVPALVGMGLQNRRGFPAWYRSRRKTLEGDPLIRHLAEQRDFIVHRGMLKPKSAGSIGVTEGRGIKLGMGYLIDPLTNSDDAMRRYLAITSGGKDPLDLFMEDEDSLPCVERRWGLEVFGEDDLVDLCATAWLRVASLFAEVVEELKGPEIKPDMTCRHNLEGVRIRAYSREKLKRGVVEGFRIR